MLREPEPQASVSTAFSSSPFQECFYYNLIETWSTCFIFILGNSAMGKKENNLLALIIKM